MLLRELISGLDIAADPSANPDVRVCDLTEDSRTVLPGSLFIARRGEKSDGRAFVPGAIAAGAVAILADDPSFTLPSSAHAAGVALLRAPDLSLAMARLAERFYAHPSDHLDLIGVTGTNGKTTTSYLIHQVLNTLGVRCGLIGTVQVDDGTEVAPADMTTPPALETSRTLARMVDAGCRAAVMEVSSHALHQRRAGALRFGAAVFTNLTGDHLDYHRTMEAYADAKAELLRSLPEGGAAIVNEMDPWHRRMLRDCRASVLRCSVSSELPPGGDRCGAAIRGASVSHTDTVFTGPWGVQPVRLPLAGEFNVMNALQAAAVVWARFGAARGGFTFQAITHALESAGAPPGRLEPVSAPESPIAVFVDYAHTDDALRTALITLRAAMNGRVQTGAAPGNLWCVFGCGGDRDRTKRPRMGGVAAELADHVLVTSDNPRTEDPAAIIDQIIAGVPAHSRIKVAIQPDRELAILAAIRGARGGDVVIIAGKGHEDYQILPDPERPGQGATIIRHFDDREVSASALAARGLPIRTALQLRVAPGSESDQEDVATWGAPGMEPEEVGDVS